jgi:hypothetical protein
MKNDGYDLTVQGLLRRRTALLHEVEDLRERVAIVLNDVAAIDRLLTSFGYADELVKAPPKRYARLFSRSHISRGVLDYLRVAAEPVSTRDVAIAFATKEGKDVNDRQLMYEISKRVSKCLGILTKQGAVKRSRAPGGKTEFCYQLA